MTNLDSVLKSRDITLPTKIHLLKAMVFPGVMHRCEHYGPTPTSVQDYWKNHSFYYLNLCQQDDVSAF